MATKASIDNTNETLEEKIRAMSFDNPNFHEVRSEHTNYQFVYWRTRDRENRIEWRFIRTKWSRHQGVPLATHTVTLSDGGGNRRIYDRVMTVTRGRVIMLDTAQVEGEPTGIGVFSSSVLDYILFGVFRHVGWNEVDLLSPIIAATKPILPSKREESEDSLILNDDEAAFLDNEWKKGKKYTDDLPSGDISLKQGAKLLEQTS